MDSNTQIGAFLHFSASKAKKSYIKKNNHWKFNSSAQRKNAALPRLMHKMRSSSTGDLNKTAKHDSYNCSHITPSPLWARTSPPRSTGRYSSTTWTSRCGHGRPRRGAGPGSCSRARMAQGSGLLLLAGSSARSALQHRRDALFKATALPSPCAVPDAVFTAIPLSQKNSSGQQTTKSGEDQYSESDTVVPLQHNITDLGAKAKQNWHWRFKDAQIDIIPPINYKL